MEKKDSFEAIYETLIGQRVPEAAVPGVENIAQGVTPYSLAWQDLLEARNSLSRRFGISPEDPDLERMINAATVMEREAALGMFRLYN